MGGVESDYSVCPCPFLQFLQFCQFMLVRLHQITSVYDGGTGRGARQKYQSQGQYAVQLNFALT